MIWANLGTGSSQKPPGAPQRPDLEPGAPGAYLKGGITLPAAAGAPTPKPWTWRARRLLERRDRPPRRCWRPNAQTWNRPPARPWGLWALPGAEAGRRAPTAGRARRSFPGFAPLAAPAAPGRCAGFKACCDCALCCGVFATRPFSPTLGAVGTAGGEAGETTSRAAAGWRATRPPW